MVNWKKNQEFNYYYHESKMYSDRMIKEHTELSFGKNGYILSKKVVSEIIDPGSFGVIYGN